MAATGRWYEPLASATVKPDLHDPSNVEFKNLGVSAKFGDLGAAVFMGRLMLSQLPYIFPGREWVTGDTKLGSPMHSFATKKLGFKVAGITMLNQGSFGHNGQPDVVLRRRIPRRKQPGRYF